MRRALRYLGGFLLAMLAMAAIPTVQAGEVVKKLGSGPAYQKLGEIPVMHVGRVKPFDTVAREEVKQIYSRETITLHDPKQEIEAILNPGVKPESQKDNWTVEKWGPVGAFLGWTVRPEFWDEQPFILAEYLPLRRAIFGKLIETRLKAIADKTTTPAALKERLQVLAADREIGAPALIAMAREQGLELADRTEIAELAAKLTEEHKWLTPHELEEAKVIGKDGQPVPFLSWGEEMSEQQHRFDDNPLSAARPTEVEKRGVEVWRRLLTYQAYSGDRFQTAGMVLIMPRPSNAALMAYTAKAVKEAQEKKGFEGLALLQLDCLKSLRTYWDAIDRDDRYMPTENKTFDDKYASWVQGSSVWVPLKVLLKSKPEDLIAAGYPETELKAFLAAYDAVNENESNSPGTVSEVATSALLTASRKLGEAVNPVHYPTVAMMDRETHFNEMNPFWQAPIPYGTAAVLLALCLGFVKAGTVTGTVGKLLYRAGLAALIGGIGLEVYGFYLRIRITGWSPVTNMYETVVWVALVSAVLSFLFELKFRQVYMALAGSCVALLGTITAANVPLLDPTIRSLQPVLRSNYWLTVHVLTIVSSYAAFALAWGLGLIATVYYLKATYRRSPRFGELALLLVPGMVLGLGGAVGVQAAYGVFGPEWLMTDRLFYAFTAMGLIGETLCVAGLAALGGELINRVQFRGESSAAVASSERNEWANDAPEMEMAGMGSASHGISSASEGGGVATLTRPSVAEIRERAAHERLKLDARSQAMQNTASKVKPLGNFIYRTMQVGVLLIAAGTILGGVWADDSWGRFWGWDPKEVWALITLLVYLIPLHGRFAGWVSSFGLVVASVVCFLSVVMAWYGVNFVLGVGLHSYGFTEGGSQGAMMIIIAAVLGIPAGAFWRRQLGYRVTA